jgi:hypothetical protein
LDGSRHRKNIEARDKELSDDFTVEKMADCSGQHIAERAADDLTRTPLQKLQANHAAFRTMANADMDIQTKADLAYKYAETAIQSCALQNAAFAQTALINQIASLCEDAGRVISQKPDDARAQTCYQLAEEYYLLIAHNHPAAWVGAERMGLALRGGVSPQLKSGINPIYSIA